MKIRNGFVSNSSSSSFIVRNDNDKEQAKKFNCTLYSVDKICEYYKKIRDVLSSVDDKDDVIIPCFMKESDYDIANAVDLLTERLEELKKLKGCFITSAVDRDHANDLDINLELFEGDL